MAIMVTLLAMGSTAFTNLQEQNVLAQAKNAVVAYAEVARNYAVANAVETMLVANPYNGRFEIWHLNRSADGGPWDPLSGGTDPPNTDGYAYAPVLHGAAALPLDGNGAPLAAVHPIDYGFSMKRPTGPLIDDEKMDNLTWAAFCFDGNGKLVTRTRRIATRSYRFRNGNVRPAPERNRLDDESPDLFIWNTGNPLVTNLDSLITSTRGFVVSDKKKMKLVFGLTPSSEDLVNRWLMDTRPGGRFRQFAETVVLDRLSGRKLTEGN